MTSIDAVGSYSIARALPSDLSLTHCSNLTELRGNKRPVGGSCASHCSWFVYPCIKCVVRYLVLTTKRNESLIFLDESTSQAVFSVIDLHARCWVLRAIRLHSVIAVFMSITHDRRRKDNRKALYWLYEIWPHTRNWFQQIECATIVAPYPSVSALFVPITSLSIYISMITPLEIIDYFPPLWFIHHAVDFIACFRDRHINHCG